MRVLTSALLSAQRSVSGVPYVRVQVSERIGGVPRLRWTRLYTGAEDDFYHAATVPGDGSLIRARVSSGGQLYLQRVTSPGPGSDFGSWSAQGSVSPVSGIALTSRNSTVLFFYLDTDQVTIKVRESTDNGGSFGNASTVTAAASAVGWLAAGISGSDVVALFYTVGTTVYVIKRTAGVWGSPAAWTNSVASSTGLACVYRLDWDLALTGSDAGGNRYLWTLLYGDGYGQTANTWSGLTVINQASSGSGVEFQTPFVDDPDVYRLFAIEKYTGAVSYSRPFWSATPSLAGYADGLWREPVPFNLTSGYGVALAHGGGSAWLSTPFGVWQASSLPASVDVTEDVLDLALTARPGEGKLTIILRNDDGRYNSAATSPGVGVFSFGGEVSVSLGYRTPTGVATASGPAYWLQGWEHRSAGGEASFVLHASDGWWLLESWRARRQFAWTAGSRNVFQLLAFVLARAGIDLTSSSASATLVNHYPAFTIQPGESGRTAVQRLLVMVPDRLFFEGGTGYLMNPQSSEASGYSYGTDHSVLEASYGTGPQETNQTQVHGKGVFTEAFTWGEIDQVYGWTRPVLDLNLDSAAEVADRAATELRRAAVETPGGHLLVPVNCGQQLYDIIDVTDPRSGLSAAKRRVLGLALDYQRRKRPRYDMRIDLGGV